MSRGVSEFVRPRFCAGSGRLACVALGAALSAATAGVAYAPGGNEFLSQPSPFEVRFAFKPSATIFIVESTLASFARSTATSENLQEAKARLAEKLRSAEASLLDVGKSRSLLPISIPLPRPRPTLDSFGTDVADKADDRSIFQKLGDLIPGRITLASLSPNDGLFVNAPNLRSMGFDELTAVYDISARRVYMPSGQSLEAHSGYGNLKDDPDHVSERNIGATPPAVYALNLRESTFHGVDALRMNPLDKTSALGREGLLVHSYMLGPAGDSNGCVSIRDYDRFLAAYRRGEIAKLAVVKNLKLVSSEGNDNVRASGL